VPEADGESCGRSFEQAFILANPSLFELTDIPTAEKEGKAYSKAEDIRSKSEFALKFAIEKAGWSVPLYVAEGLCWLTEGMRGPSVTPSSPPADSVVAPATPPQLEEARA
jgi:hypothetical protein